MRVLRVSSLRGRDSGLRFSFHTCFSRRLSRWLARFTRECERDALVITFYPCRRSCRAPDAVARGLQLLDLALNEDQAPSLALKLGL